MAFDDGAAGRAAVEVLIETGRLEPDFWLRAQSEPDWGVRQQQVYDAVQFAMGKAEVELPDWASPDVPPPDCIWVPDIKAARAVAQEPYYSVGSLYRAIIKCGGDEDRDYHPANKLSARTWRRLVPHFSDRASNVVNEIELERGNNGHTFSKQYRINSVLQANIVRDTPLHEFYIRQGEEGLKQVFHGIGQKAILGVGAMLFMSGEHDELLYTAEALEVLLNGPQKAHVV